MKIFITGAATALLLFSVVNAQAACPNLAGKYSCTDDQGQAWTHEETQSVNSDGVTVYGNTENDTAIFADGVVRTGAENNHTYSWKAYCNESNELWIYQWGEHSENGQTTAYSGSSQNFRDANNAWVSKVYGGNSELVQTITCVQQ